MLWLVAECGLTELRNVDSKLLVITDRVAVDDRAVRERYRRSRGLRWQRRTRLRTRRLLSGAAWPVGRVGLVAVEDVRDAVAHRVTALRVASAERGRRQGKRGDRHCANDQSLQLGLPCLSGAPKQPTRPTHPPR